MIKPDSYMVRVINTFTFSWFNRIAPGDHRAVGSINRKQKGFFNIFRILIRCKKAAVNKYIDFMFVIYSYKFYTICFGRLSIQNHSASQENKNKEYSWFPIPD